jgi:hypothetical protein
MPTNKQMFDETAWKIHESVMRRRFKRGKIIITKSKLRRALECEICAKDYPNDDWKALISKMIDDAKKNGHSTELYAHWLNNRDGKSHGHFQTLTIEDVHDMFD